MKTIEQRLKPASKEVTHAAHNQDMKAVQETARRERERDRQRHE